MQVPLGVLGPVIADPARRGGEPNFPRRIQDGELTAVWKLRGGALLNLFGWTLLEMQPVPGSDLPGVRRVLRDLLSIRLMTPEEHREMRRRVDLLSHHGPDALAIQATLCHRALRAIVEPFWFPCLMTNHELLAHLAISSDVAATAGATSLSVGAIGLGTGAISTVAGRAATQASGAGLAANAARRSEISLLTGLWSVPAGLISSSAGVTSSHYGTRVNAYREELALRGVNLSQTD